MRGLQPLERQWILLRTLSARRYGATLRELADEYGVSQKTIHRDLKLLRDLGFPVSPREGERGRQHWTAKFDGGGPPLSFDVSEVLALYVGRTLLEPLAGTVFWEATHSAFRKIKATLGEPALKYLDQLAGVIFRTSFGDSSYGEKSQLIDNLMVAVEDRRITFITYQSARATEPLTYDVYPYGLVFHRGGLYLVAHSQQHNEIRTFKLDRISDVSLETLTFQKPGHFDLQEYLRHSLGIYHTDAEPQRVVVRFAPEVARYVEEHRWHADQKLKRNDDGSLLVEFELGSLEEVESWVLSFGAQAIVEEPEELRERIRNAAVAMLRRYRLSVNREPDD